MSTLTAPPSAPVYVMVETLPDGRVSRVDLLDGPPPADEMPLLATIWTADLPKADDVAAPAKRIYDLQFNGEYADDNPATWASAQRKARTFQGSKAFATLRKIEAEMIGHGVYGARAQLVMCQTWGVALEHGGVRHSIALFRDGWCHTCDEGTTDFFTGPPLAPAHASPADVANAFITALADYIA
ncbi:hypothetical protein G3I60_04940 [Streptomyces sp. SID13666]|uniref:hypothetical protein n=1 Tax=Streptomyces sp. SID13666 TaxID=2706054 RepID=UPI0013BF5AF7|nr:hypothetical protein [Streptomyces sp. SID13666]NEA53515.1 hypothetical protein [Streptomyces sp. SID13666]